ncbi:MAG: tRNA uridine-5-carboxymethylaminomethyl(34) synthesis enzyme MnmG [Planctomycetes bacterium]|nr:tRNA uridine-5-carboxymethylaminomethyl(34) synthesis enzyme MnmG [Planctomycetota bacterium]
MMDAADVIVIGGGHAGVEAAAAASRMLGSGARVLMITMDPTRIGAMSCNPAIGGLAKGQMVREIDALGGVMGEAADRAGIQFRVLNASKGPAVWGPRAQCDKHAYPAEVQRIVARHGVQVCAGTVERIEVRDGVCVGVTLAVGARRFIVDPGALHANDSGAQQARPIYVADPESAATTSALTIAARAVVLTTGTFMRALMHTGETKTPGGRVGEGSAVGISAALTSLGFELGRLKTGTPPRLAKETLDWENLKPQWGDEAPQRFSDRTPAGEFPKLPQVECRQTETSAAIHDLVRANLHRAPMYAGEMEAECGPRYCPSLEDKVVRFAQRDHHGVFLEPECLFTNEIYCNGISTSLPAEVQEGIVKGMRGCEHARILRYGYAVEYDMVWPHQLDATAETKRVERLFLAGQINGTSGYEEAAAQGLVAGMNAALRVRGEEPVRLGRDEAYLGVLLDDLVVRKPREPYRMFTSRAEHRLSLRADNADQRLTPMGRDLGLVGDAQWGAYERRQRDLAQIRESLTRGKIEGVRAHEWARRPEATLEQLASVCVEGVDRQLLARVSSDLRYSGYLVHQRTDIRRQKESENVPIPREFDVLQVRGLRSEAAEVILRHRPATLGQAGRLAGVNPADVTLVALALRRHGTLA